MSHHAGATALVGADAWDAPSPIFEVAWRVPADPIPEEEGLRGVQRMVAAHVRHVTAEEPYLLSVLAALQPIAIVFRGYAIAAGEKPGLGMRLFAAHAGKVPVIGIAKAMESLHGAEEVYFGSHREWVTALGVSIADAAAQVRTMVLASGAKLPALVARARALVHGAAAPDA